MKPFRAIAAMSENRVIGSGGRIPWHLPEDFRWFKQTTMGGILVMGRKTFDSIGRALPGRKTVVLSRTGFSHTEVQTLANIDSLNSFVENDDRTVWVCGGAEIYRLLLPQCNEVILSKVHLTVEGDAFFPAFEDDFAPAGELVRTPEFHVERFVRRRLPPT